MTTNIENLGPAERTIQSLLTYTDHAFHGRNGIVSRDSSPVGVKWEPVTHQVEGEQKVVYKLQKIGKKTTRIKLGVLTETNQVKADNGSIVGEYRKSGLFAEVAVFMYKAVADVYKLDNEFAARWASYAFNQDHRDLKVVMAAFFLCQSRKGDPVLENGKVIFNDEDFRDVGEAMMLIQRKDQKDLNPKLLMRIHDVLSLPGVAAINRELGFGKSDRHPFYGRFNRVVEKWLEHRELNPKLLEGLVKAGFRTTVMDLARVVGYKPSTPKFFEILRWKQKQAKDGRRTLAIGQEVAKAESWEGLTETEICEKIVSSKIGYKRIVGLLPKSIGLTRAIVSAAIEVGSLSDKDLVILTPTLEELGLLQVKEVKERWEKAVKNADDQRAANILKNVKSKEVKETLQEGADKAAQKIVEEVTKNIRTYFLCDISGSMQLSIERAKECLSKLIHTIPIDKLHIATFNTVGKELKLQHASKQGVENLFRGISCGGGTNHRAAVDVLAKYKPADDEDVLFIWCGDSAQFGQCSDAVRQSGLRPAAFGFLKVPGEGGRFVEDTAAQLGIPCFMINENTFEDVYAVPRTIRNLISATPVGTNVSAAAPRRQSLVDLIMKQELLVKPHWAA